MRHRRLTATAFALAALAAACGGGSDGDSASGEVPAEASSGVNQTVSGGEIALDAQIEGTDTVLWFWAPW